MDFLSGLEPIQWVFLGLGAVLVAPLLFEYSGKLFSGVKDKLPTPKHTDDSCLTDLVCKWECLADAVHEAGLHDACSKLDEVFPLLLNARQGREEDHKLESEDE